MQTKTFDPYDFSKKEINGVPVYYKNLPWSPCINVRIVFNTGGFNDPVGKEGVSHFLEHLSIKGCPSIPSKKAIKAWQKENALNSLNAMTSFYNTGYTLKCLPEKYDTVLAGLKDMIFNPFLKTEDIEDERKVIIQEAWGRFQNEKYLKYIKEFSSIVFHGNQLSRLNRPLGWPETIEKITPEDVVSWHKKNYGIGNFYIIVTGAVNDTHIEKLEEFTKGLPTVDKSNFDFGIINKPTQNKIIKTSEEIGEVNEQVEISLASTYDKTSYEDSEVMSLFSKLTSDLLNEKLRTELSLCYGVSTQSTIARDFTQISISIKTDEKNIELIEKEIKNISEGIINKQYIERFDVIKKMYKEQIESQEFLSSQVTDGVLNDISKFSGHIITQEEQLGYLEKVTYEDLAKVAVKVFNPEYLVTEIILPSKK